MTAGETGFLQQFMLHTEKLRNPVSENHKFNPVRLRPNPVFVSQAI